MSDRPLPKVTSLNAPFYEAGARDELSLQQCQSCGHWVYYPRHACPHCDESRLEWRIASGRGVVQSYSHVFRPQHPFFDDKVPVILAAVRLDEGPVVIADIVGDDRVSVSVGAPVSATFELVASNVGLLHFRLVDRARDG